MKIAVICFNYSTKLTGGITTSSKILAKMLNAEFIALQGRGHYNSLFDTSPDYVLTYDQDWQGLVDKYDKIIWINPIEIHRGDSQGYTSRGDIFLEMLSKSDKDHFFMVHDEDDLPSYLIQELFKKYKGQNKFLFNCKANRDFICKKFEVDGTWVSLIPNRIPSESLPGRNIDILSISRVSVDQKYIKELVLLHKRQPDLNIQIYGQISNYDKSQLASDAFDALYHGRLEQRLMTETRFRAKFTWNPVLGNVKRYREFISQDGYAFARRLEISTFESIRHGSIPILVQETIPDFIPEELVYAIPASVIDSFNFSSHFHSDSEELNIILDKEQMASKTRLVDFLEN